MSISKSLALIRLARDGSIEDCCYALSPTMTSISVLYLRAWLCPVKDDRGAYIRLLNDLMES